MARRTDSTRTHPLSRDEIVGKALEVIDADGLPALSMRSLGAALGVEGMALYRHVSGREDLLEAVVQHVLDGVLPSLDPELTTTWQGYLQSLAHAVREVAVTHPRVFPLMATRHPAAAWLRPPLRSLTVVEHFLDTLDGLGFEDEQIATTYQAFTSFLLGHLLLESLQRGAPGGPADEPLDEGGATVPNADGRTDVDRFPAVQRLRPLLSRDTADQHFELALEMLIDRLEMTRSQ